MIWALLPVPESNAIEEKYDGIALSIAHPTIFQAAALKVKNAGIPLISFNIDSTETYRQACVCQNFINAGHTFGKQALPHLQENSTVLITTVIKKTRQ